MDALYNNQGLRELWIQCSKLTGNCIADIENMLKLNGTVTRLYLPKKIFSTQEREQLKAIGETKVFILYKKMSFYKKPKKLVSLIKTQNINFSSKGSLF